MKILLRAKRDDEDLNFILSSYLKSYRTAGDNVRMTNEVYFYNFKKVIMKLLENSLVVMAVDHDDPNHIYGFAIFREDADIPILHYIYVKYTYRKLGVAKKILGRIFGSESAVIAISHSNRVVDEIKKRKDCIYDFRYNPFLR